MAYTIPDMYRRNRPVKRPQPTVPNQLGRKYQLINLNTGSIIAVGDKLTDFLRLMGHPPAGKVHRAIQNGEVLEYNGQYRFEAVN